MQDAKVDGQLIQASSNSPDVATCPACGGEVHKRKRKSGKDGYTFFYRHRRGVGEDCPLRYRMTR
jgi:hypothetical protein